MFFTPVVKRTVTCVSFLNSKKTIKSIQKVKNNLRFTKSNLLNILSLYKNNLYHKVTHTYILNNEFYFKSYMAFVFIRSPDGRDGCTNNFYPQLCFNKK